MKTDYILETEETIYKALEYNLKQKDKFIEGLINKIMDLEAKITVLEKVIEEGEYNA
jgi:hypothetical protein